MGYLKIMENLIWYEMGMGVKGVYSICLRLEKLYEIGESLFLWRHVIETPKLSCYRQKSWNKIIQPFRDVVSLLPHIKINWNEATHKTSCIILV